jgi:O-methyltransferase involved in polyketide biosynthesis
MKATIYTEHTINGFHKTYVEFECQGISHVVCLEELPELLASRNTLLKEQNWLRQERDTLIARHVEIERRLEDRCAELESKLRLAEDLAATRIVRQPDRVFDSILGRARAQVREGNLDLAISELIAAIEALRA